MIKQHKCDVKNSDSTHIKSENGRFEQHGTNLVPWQVVGQTGAMSHKRGTENRQFFEKRRDSSNSM